MSSNNWAKRIRVPEWKRPLGLGSSLVVLSVLEPIEPERPNRLIAVAIQNADGRNYRYGDMLESGEFLKVYIDLHPFDPEHQIEIEKALQELQDWVIARSVMKS